MNKTLRRLILCTSGAAALLATSCVYDPYYTAESSYGYGGGSGYSTSVFISTGDPRWGYDPYCHSYYDYNRRAYYDPYLYGYYPVGFRPPLVVGVPHPHGWRPNYCPPPHRVRDHRLSGYHDRADLYRRNNFSWAGQVRQRDSGGSYDRDRGPSRGGDRSSSYQRPDRDRDRPDFGSPSGRDRGTPGGFVGTPGRDYQRPPGRDSSPGRDDRDRSDFRRPDFSPPDRSRDSGRGGPSRPDFQNRGSDPGRRPPSPTGANNPVNLSPGRSAPPQIDRRERGGDRSEFRPAPPSGGRQSGGGSPRSGAPSSPRGERGGSRDIR